MPFRTAIFHNNLQKQPSEVFYKKGFPKKFRNIHRKTPVLASLFNKVSGFQGCNVIKKRLQNRCFPVNIANFLRTTILKNICERLLLYLTDISEQLVFRKAIFQNSLSSIFISNFYFTFNSLNTFTSLNL